jgi:hypothetical protein
MEYNQAQIREKEKEVEWKEMENEAENGVVLLEEK